MAHSFYFTHLGGEIFRAVEEPSDQSVLWGELFREKERIFLRQNMQEVSMSFSIKDTFQLYIRTIWRPEARRAVEPLGVMTGVDGRPVPQHPPGNQTITGTKKLQFTSFLDPAAAKALMPAAGCRRKGRFALLLHAMKGRLTTSWVWMKLARELYQAGYSVVLVDLPGFGKSMVNQVTHCSTDSWILQDWLVICQMLDELGVPNCTTFSTGESCGTVLRILQRSPQQLTTEHVFYNPILEGRLFKNISHATVATSGLNYHEAQMQAHVRELSALLTHRGIRVWANFSPAGSCYDDTRYTQELLVRTKGSVICKTLEDGIPAMHPIVVTSYLADVDMAEAQISINIEVDVLFPSKALKAAYVNYLLGANHCADPREFVSGAPEQAMPSENVGVGEWVPPCDRASSGLNHTASAFNTSGKMALTSSSSAPALRGSSTNGNRRLDRRGSDVSRSSSSHSQTGSSPPNPAKVEIKQVVEKARWTLGPNRRLGRDALLTRGVQRHIGNVLDNRPAAPKEALVEEREMLEDALDNSRRTAIEDLQQRQRKKNEAALVAHISMQANLSQGVLRYMQATAKAMQARRFASSAISAPNP
eukprot:TRINITY_DN38654_c0_g2_i1.p1 TRINITY_DN38654_c0_g2~~TRINITY_DN38654_c0_g2_i1.p1  ORF type:complete len:590 (+),score=95.36 TRINITY_DN38654_c0_g2_i1:172-1941(+)